MFDNQMAEKKRIEDGAMALQRKMNQVGPLAETLQRDTLQRDRCTTSKC